MIATRVTVTLSPRHSGRVEGLCGDFDGNYNNDFDDLLTGQIAATPNDFARLWKTSPSCPDPDIPQDFDPCAVRCQYLVGCNLGGLLLQIHETHARIHKLRVIKNVPVYT